MNNGDMLGKNFAATASYLDMTEYEFVIGEGQSGRLNLSTFVSDYVVHLASYT